LIARDPERATAQESIITFNNAATEGFDMAYDSYFLSGFAPAFYSISNNEYYALNTLPEPGAGNTIPMGFVKNESSNFSIELAENLPGVTVYLSDLKTGTTVELNKGNYDFVSEAGDDANRFELHFSTLGIPGNVENNTTIWSSGHMLYVDGAGNQATLQLTDLQGRSMLSRLLNAGFNSVSLNLPQGIYLVTVRSSAGVSTQKVAIGK